MSTPTRPILRYFGGKWLLAPWILQYFPDHKIYVEPFGGAASVLLRKKRSYAEIYNDLDNNVVNVFRVMQDRRLFRRLKWALKNTPFARAEFEKASTPIDDPVELARRTIIRAFMGFGGDSAIDISRSTGFRANSNRSGTTPAHDWANYWDVIPFFHERLSGIVIENRDARAVMDAHDSVETLFYVDPPYVLESRKRKNVYRFEMSDDDHYWLLNHLKSLKGMVVLSGYPSDVYDTIPHWHQFKIKAFANGAQKRTEIIWLNERAMERQAQTEMCI